jgi:hypothetical protein
VAETPSAFEALSPFDLGSLRKEDLDNRQATRARPRQHPGQGQSHLTESCLDAEVDQELTSVQDGLSVHPEMASNDGCRPVAGLLRALGVACSFPRQLPERAY